MDTSYLSFLCGMVVAIVIEFGLTWAFRAPRRPPLPPDEAKKVIDTLRRYSWRECLVFAIVLVVVYLPVIAAWAGVFYVGVRLRDYLMPEHVFLVRWHWFIWSVGPAVFPGILSAILLAAWLTTRIMTRLLSPDRCQEWKNAHALESAARGRSESRLIAAPVMFFLVLAFVFWRVGCGPYARFDEERIHIKNVWGWGEFVYEYDQVFQIVQFVVRNRSDGNESDAPSMCLIFDNGRQWCWSFDEVENPQGFANFLLIKTGKAPVRARRDRPGHLADLRSPSNRTEFIDQRPGRGDELASRKRQRPERSANDWRSGR